MTDVERDALVKLIEWGRTWPVTEGNPESEALLDALTKLENAIVFETPGMDPAVVQAYFAPHLDGAETEEKPRPKENDPHG